MGDSSSPLDANSGLAYLFQTDEDIRLLIEWLVRPMTYTKHFDGHDSQPYQFTHHRCLHCVLQRQHLPHSDKVFHTLRRALTSFRPHLHLSIYANSLSHDDLTTVLIVYGRANAHTVAAQQPGKPQPAALHHHSPTINSPTQPPDACNISFHTTCTSTAMAMLQRYVDWTRELEFAGVQRCHRTLVDDMKRWYEAQHADEQAEVQLEYDPCHHWDYPFMVPPLSFGASPTHFSPARIARLPATIATGSLIASHWPYSSPSTASFIHALLLAANSSSPSDGSYGAYRDEQLVAWEVKQPYGAIGTQHRRDTLSRILLTSP